MRKLVAGDIMNKRVVTIRKDQTIEELARILINNRISGVPVVDEEKNILGIVTETDIIIKESNMPFPPSFNYTFIKYYDSYTKTTKEYFKTKVEEVMTKKIKTAKIDMPIEKVVNIMIHNDINRIPVVDNDNKLAGIITRTDIMQNMIKKNR
jgi:CBS domain-containing protein